MKYYGLAFIKNVFGFLFFFSIRVFFHKHWRLTGQQGKGGTIFYSALPLPPAPEHSDIYLQLCMWDDYHIFNRTACTYQTATRWDLQPYWITIWLIDYVTLVFVCLRVNLIVDFCYSNLKRETGGLELASTLHPCIISEPSTNFKGALSGLR